MNSHCLVRQLHDRPIHLILVACLLRCLRKLLILDTAVYDDQTRDRILYLGCTSCLGFRSIGFYHDCFREIGEVEWLPAWKYLTENATVSVSYFSSGLCNSDSVLYSELHCDLCQVRRDAVTKVELYILIFLEHLLILLKVFLAFVVPDKPGWVVRAEARATFTNTQAKHKHQQVEKPAPTEEEKQAQLSRVAKELEVLDSESIALDGPEVSKFRDVTIIGKKGGRNKSFSIRATQSGTSTKDRGKSLDVLGDTERRTL